jgi:phenylacetyl-CoA:acceptor oxidoreductase subunit 2
MSYGPTPWQQAHWDWRAAGNFIGGGAGSGLLIASVLLGTTALVGPEAGPTAVGGGVGPAFGAPATAAGLARAVPLLLGLALIAAGLACVWAEIGRPWRALNVFAHPQRSWMSREAYVAAVLLPLGLAAAMSRALGPAGDGGRTGLALAVAVLAAAFLYCQSRMLPAARGIPAWRAPLTGPLVAVTGLVEGVGLALCLAPHALGVAWVLVVGVGARALLWRAYRRGVEGRLAPPAAAALDGAGRRLMTAGTALPLVLAASCALGMLPPTLGAPLAVVAGLTATLAGAQLKLVLVTRAGFNQGFALRHWPVRDGRHE